MNSFFPKPQSFSSAYCRGSVEYPVNGKEYDVVVKGVITDTVKDNVVRYIAASPADRRSSFTGSGLPFHSEKQAFDVTPNRGMVNLNGKAFEIALVFPNAYYIDLGGKLVPPSLYLHFSDARGDDRTVSIKLGDPIPYRMLGNPSTKRDASFYHAHHNLPVRSQEQVLLDSAYPSKNKMAADFWGLKPAL
jgi:hypothetical protein